jgi:hypothetical protein
MSGKIRSLGLHLLDRQVVDTQGRAVGKVDDVEFVVPDDGSPPYVVALLMGPQALGPRLGGLVGQWLVFWAHALSRHSDDQPGRVGVELITDYGSSITVSRSRAELGVHDNEDRARRYIIDRIPGARDART